MEEDPDARESLQWVQATILSFKSWVVPTALPLIPISDIHYSTFKILHQILGVEVTTIIIKDNSKRLPIIQKSWLSKSTTPINEHPHRPE